VEFQRDRNTRKTGLASIFYKWCSFLDFRRALGPEASQMQKVLGWQDLLHEQYPLEGEISRIQLPEELVEVEGCEMKNAENHQPSRRNWLIHRSQLLHFHSYLLLVQSHYDTVIVRIKQDTLACDHSALPTEAQIKLLRCQ
jgi:hypothetical protein